MSTSLHIPSGEGVGRGDVYAAVLPQISCLLDGEQNLMANLANTAAVLREAFGFFWVGFYLVDGEDELVLGPFQGPVACTRIKKAKGVCGSAWAEARSFLVPDVDAFPGHIACSSASRSEVVVPIFSQSKVVAVLDIDSDALNDFSDVDQQCLEQLALILENSAFTA